MGEISVETETGAESENVASSANGSTATAILQRGFCSPRLCWLPILAGFFLGLSVIIPYCIAVSRGDVDPIFPYISDSGTIPPESCIFGQLLNFAAFFVFASVCLRYEQINEYYQDVPENVLKWNKAAVVFGSLTALGMSLVANFQTTNIRSVHLVGGALCFGVGSIYDFIQSWISYKLTPQHCSLRTSRLRLFLSIFTAIFIFTGLLFGVLPKLNREWIPKELGVVFHLVSTTSQWASTLFFISFFLTFIREFQKIETKVKRCQRLLVVPYEPLKRQSRV